MSLRAAIEQDLKTSLEGDDWGLPVVLIAPETGEEIDTSLNSADPENPDPLRGQVLYDTIVQNPDTGGEIIVRKTVVSLRRSSLSRIPLPGEEWAIKYPDPPFPDENGDYTFVTKIVDGIRAPEDGKSIGFIRLYIDEVEQS